MTSIKEMHQNYENYDGVRDYNKVKMAQEKETRRKAIQAAEKREYYKKNKERIKAMRKSAPERNRSEWISAAKDKEAFTKKYDEAIKEQKEQISAKKKEYNKANKEKISERNKVKMTCECGSIFRKDNKSKHLKTIKHCNYIKNKEA